MSIEVATDLEQRVVETINDERSAAGLDELKIEVHLNSAAQGHSDWMAGSEEFSHEGENGSSASDRIEDSEFPLTGNWRTAENIAATSISGRLDASELDRMHAGLMDSAGHRANILDEDVSYIGVGLSVGQLNVDGMEHDVLYLTQNFAETDGEVLVQEQEQEQEQDTDAGGTTVLQPYQNGVPAGEPSQVDVPTDDVASIYEANRSENEDPEDESSACFVATAAFGNRQHPDVVVLRAFRDLVLVRYWAGRVFIRTYWLIGPKLSQFVTHDGKSGRAARAFISPLARFAGRRVARQRQKYN